MPSKVYVKPYTRGGKLVKGYWRKLRPGDLITFMEGAFTRQGTVKKVTPNGAITTDNKIVQAKDVTMLKPPGVGMPQPVDRNRTATDYTKGGSVGEIMAEKPLGPRGAGTSGSYDPAMRGSSTKNAKYNPYEDMSVPKTLSGRELKVGDMVYDKSNINGPGVFEVSQILKNKDAVGGYTVGLKGSSYGALHPHSLVHADELASTQNIKDKARVMALKAASFSPVANEIAEATVDIVDEDLPRTGQGRIHDILSLAGFIAQQAGPAFGTANRRSAPPLTKDELNTALRDLARGIENGVVDDEEAFAELKRLGATEDQLDTVMMGGTANIKDTVKQVAVKAAEMIEGAVDASIGALPTTGRGKAYDTASLATYVAQNMGPALGTGNVRTPTPGEKFMVEINSAGAISGYVATILDGPHPKPDNFYGLPNDGQYYRVELDRETLFSNGQLGPKIQLMHISQLLKKEESNKMAAFSEQLAALSLSESEMDHYLRVSLMAKTGGFSKGTANVTAKDVKKLKPLMRHYAKMAHPFTACVRDNRKRFGPGAEGVCAVLKDLIKGTTKWRGKDKKANLSEEFYLEVPESFATWLATVTEEQIQEMISHDEVKGAIIEPPKVMAEMYFSETGPSLEENGLIWKTVLREGEWTLSPGAGQKPQHKPIKVVPFGKSDGKNLLISMEELKANFDAGAVEHVTIPVSHADKVTENTGYVRDLKFGKDHTGRNVLMAGMEFTEPDIKEKVKRGTIANTSGGILFDYLEKERGHKFGAVLGHVALTNKPWLNGMAPFGVQASEAEGLEVLAFSEGTNDPATTGGGEVNMPDTLEEKLGLSEDEISARLADYDRLREQEKERSIDDRVKTWEAEGKAPALVTAARDLMMADEGASVLNLSEEGSEVGLTATDIVERLVNAAPNLGLSQDPVTDKDTLGEAPAADASGENAFANLSQELKTEAAAIFLSGAAATEADAVVKAKEKLAVTETKS